MIVPIEDNNTDFESVYMHTSNFISSKHTPHCRKHGAMNKVSTFEEGGYYRCLQYHCRSGCIVLTPYFRIQEREYSSNIVERGILLDNKIKWTPYLAPLVRKEEGDKLCDNLMRVIKMISR